MSGHERSVRSEYANLSKTSQQFEINKSNPKSLGEETETWHSGVVSKLSSGWNHRPGDLADSRIVPFADCLL